MAEIVLAAPQIFAGALDFLHSHKNINQSLGVKCWCEFFYIICHKAQAKFFPFCSCSQRPNTLIYVHFPFEWWALKCVIQIGVQNPTTINAFNDAQKFIIISGIPKGFGSCLASEILQHSSFSFHCAGFEGLLRTWAELVTTSNIYLHIESPLRVPNIFPLSGDSLQLWQSAAIVNVRQRSQRNPADWKVHFSH